VFVYRLLSPFSFLIFNIYVVLLSLIPVQCLLSLVYGLLSLVLLSLVSFLLSLTSCILSPVSRLVSHIYNVCYSPVFFSSDIHNALLQNMSI